MGELSAMTDYKVKNPIIFIIFNRPEHTREVFDKIAQVEPETLIVIADGPRECNKKDEINCMAAREVVENPAWSCNLIKIYAEKNLGCGDNISQGITKALLDFEQAIILEDDCVPSLSYFRYCDELLETYAQDDEVMMISGSKYLADWQLGDEDSFFFSVLPPIGAWATWRRAWQKNDHFLQKWGDESKTKIRSTFQNKDVANLYIEEFEHIHKNSLKGTNPTAWGYQWTYSMIMNDGVGAVPSKNLITNIGVGFGSTHTIRKTDIHFLDAHELTFPLSFPEEIKANTDYDEEYQALVMKMRGNKLSREIRKLAKKILIKLRIIQ